MKLDTVYSISSFKIFDLTYVVLYQAGWYLILFVIGVAWNALRAGIFQHNESARKAEYKNKSAIQTATELFPQQLEWM